MPTLLRPGDRLAGYHIGRHIDTGGSAEVHAARTPAGAPCAIKAMRAPDAGKKRARFVQEGEVLARIVHPNVVRVLDAGAEGDLVWLALELVEGETLGQKIRAGVRLPLEDLLDSPAPAPVVALPTTATASASATSPPRAAPARRRPRTLRRAPARNRLFGTEP